MNGAAADFDAVGYLVERKFGPAARFARVVLPSVMGRPASKTDPDFAARVAAYHAEIAALPPQDLQALVEVEREKQGAELAAKAEAEERTRFFNQPLANADFDHWSRTAHWTLDEAVALSMGKAPEHVTWESVAPYYPDTHSRCNTIAVAIWSFAQSGGTNYSIMFYRGHLPDACFCLAK